MKIQTLQTELFEKQMTRKEFLMLLGATILALFGISNILHFLHDFQYGQISRFGSPRVMSSSDSAPRSFGR